MANTLLVTGAGGFVGRHVLAGFSDYNIIAVSQEAALKDVSENVTYEQADIRDSDKIYALLDEYRPEYILHLAAIAYSWHKDLQSLFDINVVGASHLFESVLRIQKYSPKIVFVSSSEVYGRTPNPNRIAETAQTLPNNPYGISKLAADRLAAYYAERLNVVIARPFNHIGPGQSPGFFVPDIASQIAQIEKSDGKKVLKVGNTESIRDFTDVRDVVAAYRLLFEKKDVQSGQVFNICSSVGRKIQDVIATLVGLSSSKIIVEQDEERMRPSEVPVFIGDATKLHNETGWEQQYSFEQSLEDALNDWRNRTNN